MTLGQAAAVAAAATTARRSKKSENLEVTEVGEARSRLRVARMCDPFGLVEFQGL